VDSRDAELGFREGVLLERLGELADVLEAIFAILFEAAGDGGAQRRGQIRLELRERDVGAAEDGREDLSELFALEGQLVA